jgi:nitrite reductase/ring-hydroxylating ferredoxin subunit
LSPNVRRRRALIAPFDRRGAYEYCAHEQRAHARRYERRGDRPAARIHTVICLHRAERCREHPVGWRYDAGMERRRLRRRSIESRSAADQVSAALFIRKTRQGKEGNKAMAEKFVAKSSELKDGDRRVIFVGDNEIGVFRHDGKFYAYSNFCLHQGGPACEGLTIAKVEERIMPDKTSRGLYFSDTEMHFVCPWHGMEYDMKTGECVSDRKMKLKKYKVVQKGDDVYVVA